MCPEAFCSEQWRSNQDGSTVQNKQQNVQNQWLNLNRQAYQKKITERRTFCFTGFDKGGWPNLAKQEKNNKMEVLENTNI